MKFLLLVCVAASCLVLSWCQSMPLSESNIADSVKKCMAQENIEQRDVADFASGKTKPENVSAAFKCFVRCIVEAMGYMKNGQLMEENIVKAAENITSVEQMRKVISSCKIAKGSNICETGFDTYMCITSELK